MVGLPGCQGPNAPVLKTLQCGDFDFVSIWPNNVTPKRVAIELLR